MYLIFGSDHYGLGPSIYHNQTETEGEMSSHRPPPQLYYYHEHNPLQLIVEGNYGYLCIPCNNSNYIHVHVVHAMVLPI